MNDETPENDELSTQSKGKKRKGNKSKEFEPPTIEEVIEYFNEKGYSEKSARKAFEHYSVANWDDSRGNPVLNWKQKMISNWFKDENKISQQPDTASNRFKQKLT